MPTRLLLDGTDLAVLMHRVRTEMGPGALVVKAERVRTGGVAGFFAKEHFELIVEVPDPGSQPRPLLARRPETVVPPVGLSALLDAADAAEVRESVRNASTVTASTTADPAASAGDGAAVLVPRLSTDARTFATLLASLDDMAHAHAPSLAVDHPAPTRTPSPAIPALGASVLAARFAPRGAVVTPIQLEPLHAPDPTAALVTATRPARPSTGGFRHTLRALGVPAELMSDDPLDETLVLSGVLARLRRPPGLLRMPGGIVAVVGEGPDALAVATQLAEGVGQDPQEVVLAGETGADVSHARRLLSPLAAARHRSGVADSDPTSIVAIRVGPATKDWPAAAALLGQLRPDQAWAIVDARRKPADVREWLRIVGSEHAFDVAAAVSVHETREPGTVLDLGLPVGWIDGLLATTAIWGALLGDRLAVNGRWEG